MDHFYIGRKFSSFDEIQAVVRQCRKERKEEFFFRDCISLKNKKASSKKLLRRGRINQALVYRTLKLCCARGGRPYIKKNSNPNAKRRMASLKIGCEAFVVLTLSECNQYLEVVRLCLTHNHELYIRPSKLEKRAEIRRQNLMKRMKISYEEAVLLEKTKVSCKSHYVGPAEIEDSVLDEKSSESFDSFKFQGADITSTSDLSHNVSSTTRDFGDQSTMKSHIRDETSKMSMDLNNSSDDSDEDYDIPSRQMISTAEKTSKKANLTKATARESEDPDISDDEDYRRPLIINVAKTQKKDNNCFETDDVSVMEESHSINKEDSVVPPPLLNIFTRKGDDGMACTFSGMRLYKDDIVFEALGTIEELSSAIGHAKEFLHINCTDIREQLVEVQCVLQDMVIHVGTPRSNCSEFHKVNSQFPEKYVYRLENLIYMHEGRLPKVNPIILPSGGQAGTALHLARAICRRAERRILCLLREGDVDRTVNCYLNRLGDYLFVAARIAGLFSGVKECFYSKPSFVVRHDLPVNIIKPTIPVFASTNQGYLVIYPPGRI